MEKIIAFLEGFKDDEMQEGILENIRTVNDALNLLRRNLDAWENEEVTVQEEHEDLIQDLKDFLTPDQYNHAFDFNFEVISSKADGADITGPMLRAALHTFLNDRTDDDLLRNMNIFNTMKNGE
ncbi:hypothetical protein ABE527_02465 [Brucella sp. TWI432]